MMEQIRNATKSWLAMVVVGILVVSFAIWGVQDVFSPDPNAPIAVVGDIDIDQGTFAQQYNLAYRQAQAQRGGNYTQAQALEDGLARDTLDILVRRNVVNHMAAELGLTTSDQMLVQEIRRNPAFAGPTGQFEQSSYAEALRGAGYTVNLYESELRADITRSQLISSLISGYFMPRGLVLSHYAYAFETREVDYFLLPTAAAGDIADPGDETLQDYFDRHNSSYRAPEYRAVTLLRLNIQDLAAQIDVAEEDIRQLYDIRHDSLQVPERRHIEQLSFPTAEAAQTALNLLNAGGDFQNVGGTYVDLGDVAQNEGIDPAVMAAAFDLLEPGTTDIIDGALSTVIARVVSITPGEATPYQDVRDQLREELAEQVAGEEIFAISENVQDALAGGEELAAIGERLNIPVITSEGVDSNGMTPDGQLELDLLATPGLVDAVFDLAEGEDTGFRDTIEGDFYVARLTGITPARAKTFDEVRDQVLADWREEQVGDILSAMATEAADRINTGVSLANVAASLGREVRETPRPVRRGDTSEIFTASMLNTLFTEPAGRAAAAPVQLGASYVVAQVTNVIPADVEGENDQIVTLRNALEDRVAGELLNAFVDDAENSLNVRINEQVLSQVTSNIN